MTRTVALSPWEVSGTVLVAGIIATLSIAQILQWDK